LGEGERERERERESTPEGSGGPLGPRGRRGAGQGSSAGVDEPLRAERHGRRGAPWGGDIAGGGEPVGAAAARRGDGLESGRPLGEVARASGRPWRR